MIRPHRRQISARLGGDDAASVMVEFLPCGRVVGRSLMLRLGSGGSMKIFRTVVVAVLLGSFFSPALALAKNEPRLPPAVTQPVAATTAPGANTANATSSQSSEAARYAAREQQSQDVQNFKGGAVYVYFGSVGILLLVIIILLLL